MSIDLTSGQHTGFVSSTEKFARKAADVTWFSGSSSQQWMPLHRGEHSLCHNIRQLIACSSVFYQHRMIQIHSLKQPIQIVSVHSCDTPQDWGSSFCWSFGSLPHCLQKCRVGLSGNCWECWAGRGRWTQIHKFSECEWDDSFAFVTLKVSLGWSAGQCFQHTLSNLKRWRTIHTSTCVRRNNFRLCAAVCVLHIHEMGTNVCDPITHSKPPDVDFESRKSTANEASWKFAIFKLITHMTALPVVSLFDGTLYSMLLPIVPKYLLTIINLVVQFSPVNSISGQGEHIQQRVLPCCKNCWWYLVIIYAWCCHLLKKRHIFANSQYLWTQFWAWPFVSWLQQQWSFPASVFFRFIFSSASLVVVIFLNSSVLDWTACGSTFASLCVQPNMHLIYWWRWISEINFLL